MVCPLFYSADGIALLILPLVNGFHSLHVVLVSGGQYIAQSSFGETWMDSLVLAGV